MEWGLVGAALGMVLSQWLRNSVALWWLRHRGIGVGLDGWGMLRLSAVALVAALAGLGLVELAGVWLGLAVTLLLLSGGLFVARPFSQTDFELLKRALKGKARFLRPLVWRAV